MLIFVAEQGCTFQSSNHESLFTEETELHFLMSFGGEGYDSG